MAYNLDICLYEYAQENGFIYTRYADDLTFSATVLPSTKSIGKLKREIVSLIRKSGFVENQEKIRIAGPGAKKAVLGLLVDGERPRLTQELRKRIDRNFYGIETFGISEAAGHDRFESVYGFLNYLSGMMSFIHDVDEIYWNKLYPRFQKLKTVRVLIPEEKAK